MGDFLSQELGPSNLLVFLVKGNPQRILKYLVPGNIRELLKLFLDLKRVKRGRIYWNSRTVAMSVGEECPLGAMTSYSRI